MQGSETRLSYKAKVLFRASPREPRPLFPSFSFWGTKGLQEALLFPFDSS